MNLASPTQLAILLYDVLKIKAVSQKSPRGTGEDILKKINLPICDLILEERGLLKLINTYIDKLPECISERDGRLHAHFNQYGAATGRFSSSDPNLQNIPSANNEIRLMFTATKNEDIITFDTDEYLEVDSWSELYIGDTWIKVSSIAIGDTLNIENDSFIVKNIINKDGKIRIYL